MKKWIFIASIVVLLVIIVSILDFDPIRSCGPVREPMVQLSHVRLLQELHHMEYQTYHSNLDSLWFSEDSDMRRYRYEILQADSSFFYALATHKEIQDDQYFITNLLEKPKKRLP